MAKLLRTILRVAFVMPLASYGLAAGAATTKGMDFFGGCPASSSSDMCDQGGNADVEMLGESGELEQTIARMRLV